MRSRRKPIPNFLHLFFEYWGITPVGRDHPHFLTENWVNEPAAAGKIRTHCKICGDFIGYRPVRRNAGGPKWCRVMLGIPLRRTKQLMEE